MNSPGRYTRSLIGSDRETIKISFKAHKPADSGVVIGNGARRCSFQEVTLNTIKHSLRIRTQWFGECLGKLDGCAVFLDEHAAKDLRRSPVGAGLLANAVCQPTSMLNDVPHSRASPLPQGPVYARWNFVSPGGRRVQAGIGKGADMNSLMRERNQRSAGSLSCTPLHAIESCAASMGNGGSSARNPQPSTNAHAA